MPSIEVVSETESPQGWAFHVQITQPPRIFHFDITLSWADYDHWSRGQFAPQDVAVAAFRFLLNNEPAAEILPAFDCAIIRRYFPLVDRELPALISRSH